MNAAPLLAPEDKGVVSRELLRRVVESLSARDLSLLLLLEEVSRVDAEQIDADACTLLWMGHFGLFGVDVDPADRVFLVRRPEGKAAIDERYGRTSEPRRRRRRGVRGPMATR